MGGEKQAVSVKNNCRLKREQDAIDIFLQKSIGWRLGTIGTRRAAGGGPGRCWTAPGRETKKAGGRSAIAAAPGLL